MSFANFDVEAQKPVGTTKQFSELDTLINGSSDQLNNFAGLISQFDRFQKQIGTKRDSHQLRNTIENLNRKIEAEEQISKESISKLSNLINLNGNKQESLSITSQQKFTLDKLSKEFISLLHNYDQIIRNYQDKKQTFIISTPQLVALQEESQKTVDENTPLFQQQQQIERQEQPQINATELEYHSILTQERDQEISRIHKGINEINAIFKDLGSLVHQQGSQIDTVEDNLMTLANNTQNATHELVKADNYQRKRRKISCIILTILCVVVGFIVLAILS